MGKGHQNMNIIKQLENAKKKITIGLTGEKFFSLKVKFMIIALTVGKI